MWPIPGGGRGVMGEIPKLGRGQGMLIVVVAASAGR